MGTATLFRPTSLQTSATTLTITGGWVSKAACVNELFPSRAARLTDIGDVSNHDGLEADCVERDNLNPVDAFQNRRR